MMSRTVLTGARAQFAAALLLDLLGAGGALLASTRVWQSVRTPREHPLADDVLHLSGRTVDAAPTALALVALAGVVAVLATRGIARRAIGAVLAAAGAALVWRAVLDTTAVSISRARLLVSERHPQVGVGAGVPQVSAGAAWAVLTAVCGVLVFVAGVLVVWRGHRWAGLSARYDSPTGRAPVSDPEQDRVRAQAALWSALDRGDDPTATG